MSTDDLIESLARVAREERAREGGEKDEDPRWEALAEGGLDPEQVEVLAAEAATSAEGRAAWEAYRPLGSDFEARMVELVEAEFSPAAADEARSGSRLLPFRRPSWRRWMPLAAAALAACLLLVLWPAGAPAPLPAYTTAIGGGIHELRDPAAGAGTLYTRSSKIEIVLRPERGVEGPLAARAYLGTDEGMRPLGLAPELSEQGSVRLLARVGEIFPPGLEAGTLYLAAGRPGSLPDPEKIGRVDAGSATMAAEHWVLGAVHIEIAEEPTEP